jgi:hypothetical protein
MRLFLALVPLALTACPERTFPERGVMLVYRKPDDTSVRATVDRRLAHLKLRAKLQEDPSRLTVRVSNSAELPRIKALLSLEGRLSFCPEDDPTAAAWCDRAWPAPLSVDRGEQRCTVQGPSREAISSELADAGVTLAFGTRAPLVLGYALDAAGCRSPHLVDAEVQEAGGQAALKLEFDKSSARDFAELTTKCVGHRMLITLDGEVQSAPVVMSPITGGRAMITVGPGQDVGVLGAALVGGPLPKLTLEKEGPYGPP